MRWYAAVLVLAAAGCSSPGRECASQFDCFGGEACVDGVCSTQVVVITDEDANSPGDADLGGSASLDMDGPTPPDMASAPDATSDVGGCSPPCVGGRICDDGQCVVPPAVTNWTLDDQPILTTYTAEVLYTVSTDALFVGLPWYGRNVQIGLGDVSSLGSLSTSCADQSFYGLGFITSDNSWAGLDDLPARWKNLNFTQAACNAPAGEDRATRWELEFTEVSATRVVGMVTIEIEGAGIRDGETLRVSATIDAVPDQM